MIANKMPAVRNKEGTDRYYILKGVRREVSKVDSDWLKKHCNNIRTEEVH